MDENSSLGQKKVTKKKYTINNINDIINAKSDLLNSKNVTNVDLTPPSATICDDKNDSKQNFDDDYQRKMPNYLEEFKAGWEAHVDRIQPPVFRQMSPRSRKKLSQLPTPTEEDMKEFEMVFASAANVKGECIYKKLTHISHVTRAKTYKSAKGASTKPSESSSIMSDIRSIGTASTSRFSQTQMVSSLPPGSAMWKPLEPDAELVVGRASTAMFDRRQRLVDIQERRARRVKDRDPLAANDEHQSTGMPMDTNVTQSVPSAAPSPVLRTKTLPRTFSSDATKLLQMQTQQSELAQYLETRLPGSAQVAIERDIQTAHKRMGSVATPSSMLSSGLGRSALSSSSRTSSFRRERDSVSVGMGVRPRTSARTILPGMDTSASASLLAATAPAPKIGSGVLGMGSTLPAFPGPPLIPFITVTEVDDGSIYEGESGGDVEKSGEGESESEHSLSLNQLTNSPGGPPASMAFSPYSIAGDTPMPPIESIYTGDSTHDQGTEKMLNHYRPVLLQSALTTGHMLTSLNKTEIELQRARESSFQQRSIVDKWKAEVYDKDGIDLDPKFNMKRIYGGALETIFYHRRVVVFKDVFGAFRANMIACNRQRRLAANALLVRVGRGFLIRRHWQHVRKNLTMKREMEERRARLEMARRLNASWLIVRTWRLYRLHTRVAMRTARSAAAVAIQRIVRGHRVRLALAQMRERKRRQQAAAITIQCFYRVRLAVREVELRRKLRAVHVWQDGIRARHKDLRAKFRRSGAAVCISSAYRSFTMREGLVKLLYYNRVRVAIDFQRIFRGHRARKLYKKMLREKFNKERLRYNSATRIQSIIRMVLAVAKLNALIDEKQKKHEAWLLKKQSILHKSNAFIELRRDVVAFLRHYTPFRHIIERRAATKIQRVYRGHWGRVIVLRRRIRLSLEPVFQQKKRYLACVRMVQRVWRGHQGRAFLRNSLKLAKALRIQCWWRLHRARKFVTKVKLQKAAGAIITRWAKNTLVCWKYEHVFRSYLLRSSFVRVIQRLARHYLSRAKRFEMKSILRAEFESKATANLAITRALSEVQLTLLAESLERPIGKKYVTRSGLDCPCLGPLQGLFVHSLGKKGQTQSSALATNRMDGSSFLKLVLKVKGLFLESKSSMKNPITSAPRSVSSRNLTTANDMSSRGNSSAYDLSSRGSNANSDHFSMSSAQDDNSVQVAPVLSLFECVKLQLARLPQPSRKLSKQECDITFNKSKTTPGVNVITYMEFSNSLHNIAEIVFEDTFKSYHQLGTPGSTRSPSPSTLSFSRALSQTQKSVYLSDEELSEEDSLQYEGSGDEMSIGKESISSSGSLKKRSESSRKFRSFRKESLGAESRGNRQSMLKIIRKLPQYKDKKFGVLFPLEALEFNSETGALSIAVMMLLAVENEEWMSPIIRWLEEESRAHAGYFVARIQRMVRRKQSKAFRAELLRLQKEDRNRSRLDRSIKCIQTAVRLFLARRRVTHRAQVVIRKYVPSTGPPYWHNPTIEKTTWQKPTILGRFECLSIPVPAPGLDFLIHCSNCPRVASTNCLNCEDSFCEVCFQSLHCKGTRKAHSAHKISMCAVCTQQMATKSCVTCALKKPKKESARAHIKKDLSITCDTCFCHVHDHTESRPEDNWAVRDSKRAMETSKDAYIVGQFIHAQLHTNHRYAHLVQPCEECLWRAAVWRCTDCDQVYCDRCLIGLHSMDGPFSRHQAETLPYYSPAMHKRFEEGALTRRVAARVERVAQEFARTQLEMKIQAVVKVQAWWRMILGARLGQAHMKAVRLEARRAFRLRRHDTSRVRSTWAYRIKDVLGLAPNLPSDTKEEAVLKRVTFLGRHRAREYIWRNMDDWGFFRESRTVPRKGVPRKGFAVGTVEELQVQARKGGFRMPGHCIMRRGETKHATTVSLVKLLPPGTFVRLQSCVFCVVAVTRSELRLDRRWRGQDGVEEILYRLPSLRDEKKRRYTKLRHKLFDIVARNPLSQNILKGYKSSCLRIAKYGRRQAKVIKVKGHMEQGMQWIDFAKRFTKYAQAGDLLLDGNMEQPKLVDLSDMEAKDIEMAIERGEDLAQLTDLDIPAVPGQDDPIPSVEKKARLLTEAGMSVPNLLKEAEKWEEVVDSLSQKPRYINKETGEKTFEMPRSVKTKRDKEEETNKKVKQFEEMKKKMLKK